MSQPEHQFPSNQPRPRKPEHSLSYPPPRPSGATSSTAADRSVQTPSSSPVPSVSRPAKVTFASLLSGQGVASAPSPVPKRPKRSTAGKINRLGMDQFVSSSTHSARASMVHSASVPQQIPKDHSTPEGAIDLAAEQDEQDDPTFSPNNMLYDDIDSSSFSSNDAHVDNRPKKKGNKIATQRAVLERQSSGATQPLASPALLSGTSKQALPAVAGPPTAADSATIQPPRTHRPTAAPIFVASGNGPSQPPGLTKTPIFVASGKGPSQPPSLTQTPPGPPGNPTQDHPVPGRKIPPAIYQNAKVRRHLIWYMRSKIQSGRQNVQFLFDSREFDGSFLDDFLDDLVHKAESGEDFYLMCLSVIHEAILNIPFRDNSPLENPQELRARILDATRDAVCIADLVEAFVFRHSISEFSDLFFSLFSPSDYLWVLEALGIERPESLLWPPPHRDSLPSPQFSQFEQLRQYYDDGELVEASWHAIVTAVAGQIRRVYEGRLSERNLDCILVNAQRRHTTVLDAVRFSEHSQLFDPEVQSLDPERLLNVHATLSQFPPVLSAEVLLGMGGHNLVRVYYFWMTFRLAPLETPVVDLAVELAQLTSSASARDTRSILTLDSVQFVLNLPIQLASVWFIGHPDRHRWYDHDRFLKADAATRWQYIVGLFYLLDGGHRHPGPLEPFDPLRFHIAMRGGVQQPSNREIPLFRDAHVLVAPRQGFSVLFTVDTDVGVPPALWFADPEQVYENDKVRKAILVSPPPPMDVRAVLRARAEEIFPVRDLHEIPANSIIFSFFPRVENGPHWQALDALGDVEEQCRSLYRLCLPDISVSTGVVANSEESLRLFPDVNTHISGARRLPEASSSRTPLPSAPIPPEERMLTQSTPPTARQSLHRETSDARPVAIFNAVLATTGQLSQDASVSQEVVKFWRLLRSLEWPAPHPTDFSEAFCAQVRRLDMHTRLMVGDQLVFPVFPNRSTPSLVQPISWALVSVSPMGLYRVSEVTSHHVCVEWVANFYDPPNSPAMVWPRRLSDLPVPSSIYFYRLMYSAPQILHPSVLSMHSSHIDDRFNRQGPPQSQDPDFEAYVPLSARTYSAGSSGRFTSSRTTHAADSSSTGSSEDSSSGSSVSSENLSAGDSKGGSRRHRHRRRRHKTLRDVSNRKVRVNTSTTQVLANETTSFRNLIGGDRRLRVLTNDQGLFLNNYRISLFYQGALEEWRRSLIASQFSIGSAFALRHPPVAQVAWYAFHATHKEMALAVMYFQWKEYALSERDSPRLAHFLPLVRFKALNNNELADWSDFCAAILGMEWTYGFFYGQCYGKLFHELYQLVTQSQLGAMLSIRYLEHWFLAILAFFKRASHDPSVLTYFQESSSPTDTTGFSPDAWCHYFEQEFRYRLKYLELPFSEVFERSLQHPVPIALPHPIGKVSEPRAEKQDHQAKTPAPAATTATSKKKTATTPRDNTHKAGTPAPTTHTKAQRYCTYDLCRYYKIPVLSKTGGAAAVPKVCSDPCPYLHSGQFPAGTSGAIIAQRLQRTASKLLSRDDAKLFLDKVTADPRWA